MTPPDKIEVVDSEDGLRAAAAEHDLGVKFDGRTLVVVCLFFMIVDPLMLGDRLRAAVAGPGLHMVVGTVTRRRDGYATKTFVNTDEEAAVVADRVAAMSPRPARTEVGVVGPTAARGLWAELRRAAYGGD